jgi:hypothetical protein
MKRNLTLVMLVVGILIILLSVTKIADWANAQSTTAKKPPARSVGEARYEVDFPEGTATPSAQCGECHQAIYREYYYGFGTDLSYRPMSPWQDQKELLSLKGRISTMGTAHSIAGTDPWPIHARGVERGGQPCSICHYPEPFQLPEMDKPEIDRPKGRAKNQEGGMTCASCHLTPDGSIRGPYGAEAPHKTVKEPKIKTSVMCAHCHSAGKRVVGKQTQTFLEWREDFHKPGLGPQQCQDCHMPRTPRKAAEDYDVPLRTVARHTWTGGHSTQRVSSALSLVIESGEQASPKLSFHVLNVGAGHSAPTGSFRRAIFLTAEVVDKKGEVVATQKWMFAPSYGDRPDDRSFLEEDKKLPDAISAMAADAQGPHETIVRAGEERILVWEPKLAKGYYTVRAGLVYDLNRFNDMSFEGDRTRMFGSTLPITVK